MDGWMDGWMGLYLVWVVYRRGVFGEFDTRNMLWVEIRLVVIKKSSHVVDLEDDIHRRDCSAYNA
jgi:hypothetical protein